MSDSSNPTPDWYPDPTGRFEQRYWDGAQWTEHVSSAGQQRTDPLPGAAPSASTGEDLPDLSDLSEGAGLIDSTPDTSPPPGWGEVSGAAADPMAASAFVDGGSVEPQAAPQPEPVTPTAEPAAASAFVDPGQAAEATPAAAGPAPDWYADPTGRYELRYWDGAQWTEHASQGGQQGIDPLPDQAGDAPGEAADAVGQTDGGGAPEADVNPFAAAAEASAVDDDGRTPSIDAPEGWSPAPDRDPEPTPTASPEVGDLPAVPGIDSPGAGAAVPPSAGVPVASAAPPPVGSVEPATEVLPVAEAPDAGVEDDESGEDDGPGDGPGPGPGSAPEPAPQPAPAATGPAPDWYPDPTGRQELRYWDGVQWTEHGSSGGQQVVDPIA